MTHKYIPNQKYYWIDKHSGVAEVTFLEMEGKLLVVQHGLNRWKLNPHSTLVPDYVFESPLYKIMREE